MRILVDMDGVLANFELGFLNTFRNRHPNVLDYIPLENRTNFYLTKQYPEHLKEKVDSIMLAQGFFKSLPPIKGALAGMQSLVNLGHEVFICTSPFQVYKHCVLEKYEWVDAHLGDYFVNRIILTRDKTLIFGDILIDDKPLITGVQAPAWEHVVFSQPYNQQVVDRRRMTWENREEVIGAE